MHRGNFSGGSKILLLTEININPEIRQVGASSFNIFLGTYLPEKQECTKFGGSAPSDPPPPTPMITLETSTPIFVSHPQ